MSTNHTQWMHTKQKTVTVILSLSSKDYEKIRSMFDCYEEQKAFEAEVKKCRKVWTLTDVSLHEAQTFAEPLRMAHPDQCVSLVAGDSYIGNTSWTDQMEMFWEYPVYTEGGRLIQTMRKRVASEKNLVASYE